MVMHLGIYSNMYRGDTAGIGLPPGSKDDSDDAGRVGFPHAPGVFEEASVKAAMMFLACVAVHGLGPCVPVAVLGGCMHWGAEQ